MDCIILSILLILVILLILTTGYCAKNCNYIQQKFENFSNSENSKSGLSIYGTATELPVVKKLNKNIRLCIFMVATPEIHHYSEFTIKQNKEWAKLHNYDFVLFDKKHKDTRDLPINFSKIQYAIDLIDTGLYDYVMYIDADAIVHNLEYDIRNLIQEKMGKLSLKFSLFGEDCYNSKTCSKPGRINSGVFIVSRGIVGKETMKLWLKSSRGSHAHLVNVFPNCQNIFTKGVYPWLSPFIGIIPFNIMNGFGDTLLIKHAMAMDDIQRIDEIKKEIRRTDERIRVF